MLGNMFPLLCTPDIPWLLLLLLMVVVESQSELEQEKE